MRLAFTLNGRAFETEAEPDAMLVDVLRQAGVNSPKVGCGQGTCGACTVLLDGRAVPSCITFAALAAHRAVTTVEGLGTPRAPHPLQVAFVEAGAVQCGFCTPGMILAAKALLDETPRPTEAQIREALDGNLCRCTGYVKIVEAVGLAAARLSPEADAPTKETTA